MADIDAVDSVEGGVENIEVHGEMQPYAFHFMPNTSSSWNGREVSLLLPAGTQYSKGSKAIYYDNKSTIIPELVDGSSGIPVSSFGNVIVSLATKTCMNEATDRVLATLSFSLLPKDISTKEYFARLKNSRVQILKESENTLVTKLIAGIHSSSLFETFEKTIIEKDMILKIKIIYAKSYGLPGDQLLEMIQLVPQASNS